MDNCVYTELVALEDLLDKKIKQENASRFLPFDYYMLMTKVPTDKKGKVNKSAYGKQKGQANRIKEALLLTNEQLSQKVKKEKEQEKLKDYYLQKEIKRQKSMTGQP